MGVTGLLPLLKKASKNSHVRKFSGCTAAIDAYGWLHKGSFGCAEKLGKGEPTTAYITYCMKYIQVLLDNKIKPILVLDGRNLPSKEHTEKQRRKKRDENRKLARKYLQEGKKKEAWECFTRCVDITPTMAREFIKVLRSMNIDYVVSPYEADAELAYLALTGIADIIITEDSDLVVFGCPRIFFKMNVNGDGVFFELSKLPQCFGLTQKSFQFNRFRWMCILSGCDYLPSIPGIGLGRAKKVIDEMKSDDIREMILSIPGILPKVQVEVTEEYIAGFIQAENTFLYQLVFDTRKRMVLPLNPYPDDLGPKDLPFCGSYETKNISLDLALGNIDLHTLKQVDSFEPLKAGYTTTSIWSSSFRAGETTGFEMKQLNTTGKEIGMQISVSKGSAGPSSKKKRPLAVVNSDNEDNGPDDDDLMKMYEDKPPLKSRGKGSASRKASRDQEDNSEEEDCKPEVDSLTPSKRRRVTEKKKEEENLRDNSPSCNTRASRSRAVPFLKSPQGGIASKKNVHVKSKYFRTEEKNVEIRVVDTVKKEIKEENNEEEDTSEEEDDVTPQESLPPNLNIYSYESSSQDSALSDISASQRSFSQQSSNTSQRTESDVIAPLTRPCSVVFKKSDAVPLEITLEEDDEDDKDEAYGSSGGNKPVAPKASTSSSFSTVSSIDKFKRQTPSVPSAKTAFRRQGLSRSAKKDPKQPSVRDMFVRHKSVQ